MRKAIVRLAGKVLEKRFHTSFREADVGLVGGVRHRFDLVSRDLGIFVEVATPGLYRSSSGSLVLWPTQLNAMTRACFFLLGVKQSETRLLIVANRPAYDLYIRTSDARLARALGVEIEPLQIGSEEAIAELSDALKGSLEEISRTGGVVFDAEAFGPVIPTWPVPTPPVQPVPEPKPGESKPSEEEEHTDTGKQAGGS